jgi:uncharacterized OsmC-like protein
MNEIEGGSMAIHTFKAQAALENGMAVDCTSRTFHITADEPRSMRGTDTGMNPVEMLLSALGACQCITARLFAQEQGIDLHQFRVELEGDLDPSGFMKGREGVRTGFQEIRMTIHIASQAPPEAIDRFVAFVKGRCPVGDMLQNGVPIVERHILLKS